MFGIDFLSFEATQHSNLWIWEELCKEGRRIAFHYGNSKGQVPVYREVELTRINKGVKVNRNSNGAITLRHYT